MTSHSMSEGMQPEVIQYEDLGLVSYLRYCGFHEASAVWNDHWCSWNFEPSSDLLKATEDFFQGKATVDPQKFFLEVAEVKKSMYRAKPK